MAVRGLTGDSEEEGDAEEGRVEQARKTAWEKTIAAHNGRKGENVIRMDVRRIVT